MDRLRGKGFNITLIHSIMVQLYIDSPPDVYADNATAYAKAFHCFGTSIYDGRDVI